MPASCGYAPVYPQHTGIAAGMRLAYPVTANHKLSGYTMNVIKLIERMGSAIPSLLLIFLASIGAQNSLHAAQPDGKHNNAAGFKQHEEQTSEIQCEMPSAAAAALLQVSRKVDRRQRETPRQVVAYNGYGNSDYLWIQGRVLADKPIKTPGENDSWWDNLRATYQRWETDEIPGVRVELDYLGNRKIVWTDDEGYYNACFPVAGNPAEFQVVVAKVETGNETLIGKHRVLLADPQARFMIISDMDDTVIHTGITRKLLAARLTFLHNAHTRKPLDGVADLYRELVDSSVDGARNPVFYVSNSGWNMYDVLRDFLVLNDIPPGPLLLRDLGGRGEHSTKDHKAETFRTLLQRFPEYPAVLIGDSGQHDAALYSAVAAEFPGRVLAIYIRDVDPDKNSRYDRAVDAIIRDGSDNGVPMIRGKDSEAFATHMREIGLLSVTEEEQIAESVERVSEADST